MGLHWLDRMTLDGSPAWELGYWLGFDYWGQGYPTAAALGLIGAVCQDLCADELVAGYATTNSQSGHVLEKLGYYMQAATSMFPVLATGHMSKTKLMRRSRGSQDRRRTP
ncbi:hypothetical protein PsB1_0929 [Candidatus Phycosocius spiralis]|uniref:N-acetyltransferase domain-containing protein n=2 Tax=Candidatus Phycosocius spiralis TaxID=2815099 RepID=A0ABQ4PUV2_9PROT|nr:hypothetical protein PsB1_0929 [Candidatus Phycosocius spiralis]